MKLRSVFILLGFLAGETVLGQEKYGELTVSAPESLTVVVRNETQSAVIVVSEVPDLQFESTRQIFETKQRGASEWQLVVEPGRQILTIRGVNYLPVKTEVINLRAKRAYQLKVSQVKPAPGTLFIKTKPEGAGLRIDGVLVEAKTPYRFEEALPGQHYVQVFKEGYRAVEKTLLVESKKLAEWESELTQTAVRVQIDLANKLQDAGILINGEAKGVAPGAIYLEPGSYRLTLQKAGYTYAEKVIDILLGPEELLLKESLDKIKKPFMLVKLNLGYPLGFSNDAKGFFTGGWVTGFEVLFGKRFLIGASFDYTKLIASQAIVTGEQSSIPLAVFRDNVTTQFYSVALMYKPYSSLFKQSMIPFIQLKLGLLKRQSRYALISNTTDNGIDVSDDDRAALAIAAGIDIPFRSSLHLFANFDYSFTTAIDATEFGDIRLNASRTCVTGKLGAMIYF